jgi:hypothetical protein
LRNQSNDNQIIIDKYYAWQMPSQEEFMRIQKIMTSLVIGLLLLVTLIGINNLADGKNSADQQAVNAANQLYQAGNYGSAISIYEELIFQGVDDAVVFYNLGNAYYQSGELGRAVLNLQRAALLEPRDADIQANLNLVRAESGAMDFPNAAGPVQSLANLTRSWLNLNETGILALGAWFSFAFMLYNARLSNPGSLRSMFSYLALFALLVVMACTVSLGSRVYSDHNFPSGVVVAPIVTLSSTPQSEDLTKWHLPGGTEVNLLDTQDDWTHLSLPGKSVEGWIPVESVEPLRTPAPASTEIF